MSEDRIIKGSVVCIGFINGTSIIGTVDENAEKMAMLKDTYFLSLIRNPESKERTFEYRPILAFSERQVIGAAALAQIATSESVFAIYVPNNNVVEAYKRFIGSEASVANVLSKSMQECGPSKEFIDKLLGGESKPQPVCKDGVIVGAFGLNMHTFDDEEGQG